MTRVPTLLLLVFAAPVVATADDGSVAERIAPFLGPRTLFVGHLDVERIDVDATIDLLRVVEPAGDEAVRQARTAASAFRDTLLELKIGHLFAVYTWDDFDGLRTTRPVLVVPVRNAGDARAVVTLLTVAGRHVHVRFGPRGERVETEEQPGDPNDRVAEMLRGSLVMGTREAIERLRTGETGPRPDLVAALASAGEAPVRFAVASRRLERRAMRAMSPTLPAPLGRRYADLLTRADWLAGSIDAKLRPSLRIEMPNGDDALAMLEYLGEARDFCKKSDVVRAQVPGIGTILDAFDLTATNNRVRMAVNGEDDLAALVRTLRPKVEEVSGAITRDGRVNVMKQLGLAFHNYADAHGHFPPTANRDEEGKPLLSWRVHILPFLGKQKLYQRFHWNEPWDSPHNKPLLKEMPAIYAFPGGEIGMTNYVRPVMPGSIASAPAGTKFRDIKDGTSNTMLVVDVGHGLAVPWTKPADWEVDAEDPLAGVVRKGNKGFLATFADGAVHTLEPDIAPKRLRAVITMDGGEVIE